MKRVKRCELCMYWDQRATLVDTPAEYDGVLGYCCRYPPQPVKYEDDRSPLSGLYFGKYMLTYDTDGCGEFNPGDIEWYK